jgi:4-diphosphocytidyl-2-C-methyl-D-erythritol kinase
MLLKAHAKVNLGLAVTGKRNDGYHNIDTLFARLELHDLIELELQESGITLTVEGAELAADASNLCYKAAELYLKTAGISRGVAIKLEKHIPIAAGLGGGSADAAAVLRGLKRLYPARVDLLELATQLGSDVPFFVLDTAAARGRGRGEVLEPITLPTLHLVLVNPGLQISAKEAYEQLQGFSTGLALKAILENLKREKTPAWTNDLQKGITSLYPEIEILLQTLSETGLKSVLMSGSGSSCFGLTQESSSQTIAAALQNMLPAYWVKATQTY